MPRTAPLHRSSTCLARRLAWALTAACIFASAVVRVASARATPSFLGLGDVPGGAFNSLPTGVSDDGTTVVGYGLSTSVASTYDAFRWTAATGMSGLGADGLAVPRAFARGVSADGSVIVGDMRASAGAPSQPFRWTAATGIVVMQDPGGVIIRGQAFAVSADGLVATGVGATATGNQVFRWTPATGMVGLGWVPNGGHDSFGFGISNDGATIVGLSGFPNVEPFRWTQATGMFGLGDVPGGIFYAIA